MFQILIQMFLGWPAMIVSLLFACAGIGFKKWDISVAGAILLLPPAWYLSHYSLLYASFPFLLFGAAYAISKGRIALAALLSLPVFIGIAGLGIVVLTQ